VSVVLLKVLDATVGLRVKPQEEMDGLDITQHNEQGYNY
jgi:Amt family ammonium transporter